MRLLRWQDRLANALAHQRDQFWASALTVMTGFGLVVGIGSGIGAALTILALRTINDVTSTPVGADRLLWLLLPAAGGLFAGLILWRSGAESTGLAVSDVVAALITRRGEMRPMSALARAAAGIIAIGLGGSAGPEGPAVHIGAGVAAVVGRYLKLDARRVSALIAAGCAGGIAAVFNAPLAGIMFTLEVILADVGLSTVAALVVASTAAAMTVRSLLGGALLITIPAQAPPGGWELPLFALLGILAALVGVTFCRGWSAIADWIGAWPVAALLRPTLGGLAVGVIGYAMPDVLGIGEPMINRALLGAAGAGAMLALMLAKMAAAPLTIASGSPGGVLTPSLFIGAMLGGATGHVLHALLPTLVPAGGSAYAAAGMAAVFASVGRAPVTAVLLVLGLAPDQNLAAPAVIAAAASAVVSQALGLPGIYTSQLRRRGIEARPTLDAHLMRTLVVEDAMTPIEDLETVTPATSFAELSRLFHDTAHHGFLVLNADKELFGVVTLADLERAMEAGRVVGTVDTISTRDVLVVFPHETLDEALRRLASLDIGRIPVVDRQNRRRVIGMLRRGDILRAYARALTEPGDEEEQARTQLQAALGAELAEFVIAAGDAAAGCRLRQLGLPSDTVVISIHRAGSVVVPRGNTQLLAGDRIIILKVATPVSELRRILHEGPC